MANETKTTGNQKDLDQAQVRSAPAAETVEVLYQKLGNRWYAFSLINDDVFVGSINPEELDAPSPKLAAKA
ncbi:MAG: hypothetical protein P4M08_02825 [Oligoflexia bacterium]|nr:hypothetical protein [Oligoflexia bacterium]